MGNGVSGGATNRRMKTNTRTSNGVIGSIGSGEANSDTKLGTSSTEEASTASTGTPNGTSTTRTKGGVVTGGWAKGVKRGRSVGEDVRREVLTQWYSYGSGIPSAMRRQVWLLLLDIRADARHAYVTANRRSGFALGRRLASSSSSSSSSSSFPSSPYRRAPDTVAEGDVELDTQIRKDIRRCHAYHALLRSPKGQDALRRVLHSWVALAASTSITTVADTPGVGSIGGIGVLGGSAAASAGRYTPSVPASCSAPGTPAAVPLARRGYEKGGSAGGSASSIDGRLSSPLPSPLPPTPQTPVEGALSLRSVGGATQATPRVSRASSRAAAIDGTVAQMSAAAVGAAAAAGAAAAEGGGGWPREGGRMDGSSSYASTSDERPCYWQSVDTLCAPLVVLYGDDEVSALATLEAMINKYLRHVFAPDNAHELQKRLLHCRHLLAFHDPALASHLGEQGVTPDLYAIPWVMSMFSTVLPIAAHTQGGGGGSSAAASATGMSGAGGGGGGGGSNRAMLFDLWDIILASPPYFVQLMVAAFLIALRKPLLDMDFNQGERWLSVGSGGSGGSSGSGGVIIRSPHPVVCIPTSLSVNSST